MQRFTVYVFTLVLMASIYSSPSDAFLDVIGRCWDTWSRCTGWSSAATGILWKSCNDRCKELGKSGGNCVLSPSTCPLSSEAYQCQCH